jgi:hypothetical protein
MKYRTLNKWDAPKESINLIYFSQLFDELFFDFSLDTYKPSAMNSSLLCEEALELIDEIKSGNIKPPNFQHVVDELCENLSKDNVAKSLITIDDKQINKILRDPKTNFDDKRTVIELISRQIYLKKYKNKNEELIKEAILGDVGFSNIRSLARSYATTLVNLGFSSEYISENVKKFFYYDRNRIANNQAINDFIAVFSERPKIYTVIFKCSKSIDYYRKSCEVFSVEIIDSLSNIDLNYDKDKFNRNGDELFICLKEIKARDIVSAKNNAERLLEMFSTIFGLFHHKEQLKWSSDCLIVNEASKETCKSRTKVNAMHKCIDQKLSRAAKLTNAFLTEFGLEKNSFTVFTRAAELHSLALMSDSKENQMLNLWIALESIIPAKHDDKTCNIEHIINSLMPFLNIVYYQRLVARFTGDIFNWNRGVASNVLKGIDGDSQIVKVGKLISLEAHKDLRKQLAESFNDFHLMNDRFEYLCFIFEDPKNMLNGLKTHSKRVGWQIRRIYRARNLIVHSGTTPSYTEMLIENTHDYLDTVINQIIKLASESKKITTIEQAFKYVDMKYSAFEDELSAKDVVFTTELLERIFGDL